MNANHFSAAVAMARNSDVDLSAYDDGILDGFGLPEFKPVHVVLEVAAKCIRWQCCQLNGGIDNEALEQCREAFRHRVFIVGADHTIIPALEKDE